MVIPVNKATTEFFKLKADRHHKLEIKPKNVMGR
jgi:hypothetical protein